MTTVEEALRHLAAVARPTAAEKVPVAEASGRVLASPAAAAITHPATDVSAMDGYAVAWTDPCRAGTPFAVVREAPAGTPHAGAIDPGEAVRVFTGSVMPDGTNHVVVQEDVTRETDVIVLHTDQPRPRNVRSAGGDFEKGAALLPSGTALSAVDLGLLASANLAELKVHRRPRVSVFANGDELREPGAALGPGLVVCSTPPAVLALVREWGGEPIFLGTAPDDPEAVGRMFDRARDEGADIVVPIGGASVGDYDFVKKVGQARFALAFDKVAVRPGKPVWFGTDGDSHVLGLPGNPASALTCAILFLRPLLFGLSGRGFEATRQRRWARLTAPVKGTAGREHYIRAAVEIGPDGTLTVAPQPEQDTSLLRPFAASNALLRRPAGSPAAAVGELVEVVPFGPL